MKANDVRKLSAAELEFNRPGREFLLKNALMEVEGKEVHFHIEYV